MALSLRANLASPASLAVSSARRSAVATSRATVSRAAPQSLSLGTSSSFLQRATDVSSSSSLFQGSAHLLTPTPANDVQRVAAVKIEAKYKLKTHKASAKRFKVTGSGKVVRRNAWRAHLLAKKSTKRKNRLAGMSDVFRGDLDKIIGAMPYLKVNRRRLPPAQRAAQLAEVAEVAETSEEVVE